MGKDLLDHLKTNKNMKTSLIRHGEVILKEVSSLPKEAEKNPNSTAMQAILCGLTIDEYVSMKLES